ncbi:MAG: Arm DNA-binding domain-containing protein, partial [Desulfobulbus sp.]|nr:Arm DNA-binding domain-containing protein [Desulfobulbus sp.]
MNIAQIKAAIPGEILRDDQVTGLHLRVFENRKSFYLYFRTKAGKERRPKIGDYGNITLDQARRAARDMLFKVSLGEDPVSDRKVPLQAVTVATVWPRYWSEHAEGKKTASEDKRIYEKHFPDWFKNLPVDVIAYPEVYRLHDGMKNIPYQANRTVALVSKFLRLCEQWNLRPIGSNPCQHVKR